MQQSYPAALAGVTGPVPSLSVGQYVLSLHCYWRIDICSPANTDDTSELICSAVLSAVTPQDKVVSDLTVPGTATDCRYGCLIFGCHRELGLNCTGTLDEELQRCIAIKGLIVLFWREL